MAKSFSNDQTVKTKPIDSDIELSAAKFASVIAESMDFTDDQIEEIQLAMIETCINAIEHSENQPKMPVSQYIISTDHIEFKITDLRV